jgi:murein peptide amidase A
MPNRVNVDQFLIDLQQTAQSAGFSTDVYGSSAAWPLYGLSRRSNTPRIPHQQIYISAGIHGDEPAGPLALLELLRRDALPRDHDIFLCPLMNPAGLAAGTRENTEGIDLNRDYTDFRSAETIAHRDWVQANITRLDLALHLHEDWEATGFYLYELNFSNQPSRSPAILQAAKAHLPIESAHQIDDHPACDGVIRPKTLPDIPAGLPEAIYFQQQFGGINHTLETPSALKLEQRVAAQKTAVLAAIGITQSPETLNFT